MSRQNTKRKTQKGGRPPKAGVDRYQNGRIVNEQRKPEETEEQIQSVVLFQRRKWGVAEKDLRDQKAESHFGRLCLTGVITAAQYEAGRRYARTVERYYRQEGIPSPWPAAIDLNGGPKGLSGRPEPDVEETDRVKRDYADMLYVLNDLAHSETYRGVTQQMRSAILMDHDIRFDAPIIGNVRSGLNVLIRLWGMQG